MARPRARRRGAGRSTRPGREKRDERGRRRAARARGPRAPKRRATKARRVTRAPASHAAPAPGSRARVEPVPGPLPTTRTPRPAAAPASGRGRARGGAPCGGRDAAARIARATSERAGGQRPEHLQSDARGEAETGGDGAEPVRQGRRWTALARRARRTPPRTRGPWRRRGDRRRGRARRGPRPRRLRARDPAPAEAAAGRAAGAGPPPRAARPGSMRTVQATDSPRPTWGRTISSTSRAGSRRSARERAVVDGAVIGEDDDGRLARRRQVERRPDQVEAVGGERRRPGDAPRRPVARDRARS